MILQIFGDASTSAGVDFSAYQATAAIDKGMIVMSCILFSPDLPYDTCNEVFNTLVLPK